ncbi:MULTISPECIES: VRR-NUC domain-containing protein [Chromohalobacter]|uniref:VRR-NUC domain-containing protein n=1 Tax=Chromohalobacter TaxID=42054 RepID=UPI001FFD21C2|nr:MULTISPECIES: VRR-NUC domain-containing protein [Chromohalobacter]MCK2044909.1 VRR-NUC domain-containing protein [Chromohalobacter moromii]MCT8467896.1 VRR-NUC domain-containing protein [Chromohalobacter canadensis]MCT8470355.1 VRR-NUC domain-containing protein [Chromohalobacter canadensis]MCT8498393.1 VRR-NUC domain-containing protein [Chromohalobacter canadensis]
MNATPLPPRPASLDDPLYYLHNFRSALRWIEACYVDLFDDDERDFLTRFDTLPEPAQALWVRMVMRKGDTFRDDRLGYAEIGMPATAVAPLIERGWVQDDPPLSVSALWLLLTKTEIGRHLNGLLRDHGLTRGARKADMLEVLAEADLGEYPLTVWCPEISFNVVRMTRMALCDRLRLMFFGNLHQDWSEFVLADLGVRRFERVPLSPASRAFQRREDIHTYAHLHACRERLEAGEPIADILHDVPAADDNPWLENRRGKLLFLLARAREREGELAAAEALYAQSVHPGARGRHLRMLERQACHAEALERANAAAAAPESESERQQLDRLLPRLHRRLALAPPSVTEEPVPARLEMTLPRTASVERAVVEHLSCESMPVYYVENALINALFGLLCWEAVFAPLAGAFFHPFQRAPADLLRPEFASRRETLFTRCLARLEVPEGEHGYRAVIRRTYHAKHGLESAFVQWEALDETLLEMALACLPAAHLRLWFERLLRDVRANRAGMPDLIQFRPEQGDYRMIEVKGPGDRLQDNQRRWLAFCARHGMPLDVCHVTWAS